MSEQYGYTPEEMRNIGRKLKETQAEIQGKVQEALTAVNGLIGSGFTTAVASGAYSDKFTELKEGLIQVNEGMGPLGDFLTQYASSVEELDQQMGQSLRG
ncbi:WXG100 family type VII secretion target [Buchananella hordeovulneris]|uniref:WXG100 family type VII secretion target n=1 Tax=Buchananella hordeovulneris TaxID=52770 RepID=A0A1Q5PYG6_9ACTO|nr:WXG100 family type VII secretion target [Buchananella hordeovulneris]MDO5080624.1 WXG100 family type VII secretion target [Buchananella hordeovulneris]OKL52567.1 hypothetical protein BSZ40_00090 [Buchananella hordeovulneris]RRD42569.1 hypothetical protein EII13_09160 [Buchananella hordeovulneris]RRD52927.1 hypothetical protein EII12_03365 [Buchananella hordeovulneris]